MLIMAPGCTDGVILLSNHICPYKWSKESQNNKPLIGCETHIVIPNGVPGFGSSFPMGYHVTHLKSFNYAVLVKNE